jgi:AcrR family transcriptional regulator
VIDAATELFSRRGYRGTTLAAIAEALGVTDAALLRHFDSKADILEAVLAQDDVPSNEQFLENLAGGALHILEQLAATGLRMDERPRTTRLQIVLAAEALGEGSELHGKFVERYRYVRRALIKALQRGIDSGEIRSDVDPVYEVTALLSFVEGLRINWFYYDGDAPLDGYVTTYVEQVIARIAARPPASGSRRG